MGPRVLKGLVGPAEEYEDDLTLYDLAGVVQDAQGGGDE